MDRTCRYCDETFPLTKDYFGHNPQGGFRRKCRKCMRNYVRRYNAENSDRARERTEWRVGTTFTAREKRDYGRQIALRDGGYVCFYCKHDLDSSFHIDHKIPIVKGGSHSLENFVLACMSCNQEKHAKDINEYRVWRIERGLPVEF